MMDWSGEIIRRAFGESTLRVAVARQDHELLHRPEVLGQLEACGVQVRQGDAMALRLLVETLRDEPPYRRVVFLPQSPFPLMEDLARRVRLCSFAWMETVEHEGVGESPNALPEGAEALLRSWQAMGDWDKAPLWLPGNARLMASALEQRLWREMEQPVERLNQRFLAYLRQRYSTLLASHFQPTGPRMVTQVLGFMAKEPEARQALVVVDGMNLWQGSMLADELERRYRVAPTFRTLLSWLPSETELSRQALFRGGRPEAGYAQSPDNEARLWKAFWKGRHLLDSQHLYQHSGLIPLLPHTRKVGYVTTELDSKMHASTSYYDLHALTGEFLHNEAFFLNIEHLLNEGFTLFITSDHGNIETIPYLPLDKAYRLGSQYGERHVTLSPHADRQAFEQAYAVHRLGDTYYPDGRRAFSGKAKVTHGGTHWLEVVVPFLTLTK